MLPTKFNYYGFFILGFMACLIVVQPYEFLTNFAIFILLTWIYLAWLAVDLMDIKKSIKKD